MSSFFSEPTAARTGTDAHFIIQPIFSLPVIPVLSPPRDTLNRLHESRRAVIFAFGKLWVPIFKTRDGCRKMIRGIGARFIMQPIFSLPVISALSLVNLRHIASEAFSRLAPDRFLARIGLTLKVLRTEKTKDGEKLSLLSRPIGWHPWSPRIPRCTSARDRSGRKGLCPSGPKPRGTTECPQLRAFLMDPD